MLCLFMAYIWSEEEFGKVGKKAFEFAGTA
jgi:hypothetical protein